MQIGVPKEIKTHEYRVGITPAGVRELTAAGHRVRVQAGAGQAIGFDDALYAEAGAEIVASAEAAFDNELVVKVKEPQADEIKRLGRGQVLFTYLHLAADRDQTDGLLASGCSAIAYETVTDDRGHLPLLAPMSEVAGRMSIQAGAHALELAQGGRGTLLGGVPGVEPGRVTILGGGVVGTNAARMAVGLGADVSILDLSPYRLQAIDDHFQGRVRTVFANSESVEAHVLGADLVVGAVLVAGAAAPRLVSESLVRRMQRGAVVVDVAIDQGGCIETSRPTTHDAPTFVIHDVVHYCVANMPGAVARTATLALTNVTLGRVKQLADRGLRGALGQDPHLRAGLGIHEGRLTCRAVADGQDRESITPEEALGIPPVPPPRIA